MGHLEDNNMTYYEHLFRALIFGAKCRLYIYI